MRGDGEAGSLGEGGAGSRSLQMMNSSLVSHISLPFLSPQEDISWSTVQDAGAVGSDTTMLVRGGHRNRLVRLAEIFSLALGEKKTKPNLIITEKLTSKSCNQIL